MSTVLRRSCCRARCETEHRAAISRGDRSSRSRGGDRAARFCIRARARARNLYTRPRPRSPIVSLERAEKTRADQRAAGKLPQFRDVRSLGMQFRAEFRRFAGAIAGRRDQRSALLRSVLLPGAPEVCRAIRDLEKYAVASPARIEARYK